MHSLSDIHGTLLTSDVYFHPFYRLGCSQQPSTYGKCYSINSIWAANSSSSSSISNKHVAWLVADTFSFSFVYVRPGDTVLLQQ